MTRFRGVASLRTARNSSCEGTRSSARGGFLGVPDLDGQVDLDAVVKEPRLDGLEVGRGRGTGLSALLLGLDVVEQEVAEPRRLHGGQRPRSDAHEATEEGERAKSHIGGHARALGKILPPPAEVGVVEADGAPGAEARRTGHERGISAVWYKPI